LYWCETCSFTLRKQHRLSVREWNAVENILEQRRKKRQEVGNNCSMRSFTIQGAEEYILDQRERSGRMETTAL
jgi:hypothetical protein